MNSFALASDSHSWWLPSAIVGGLGAVALGAILVLPTIGGPAQVNNAPGTSVSTHDDVGRSCFMQRPPRNHGDQLPQPACR
jgi:hypothetical protein